MLKFKSLPMAEPKEAAEVTLPELKVKAIGKASEYTQLVAVQVAVTEWTNQATGKQSISGAWAKVMSGKAHRLDVTRIIPLERPAPGQEQSLTKEQYAILTTKLGSKQDDKLCRPEGRHSLVMWQGGPAGLSNLKPWIASWNEIGKGIEAARSAAAAGGGQIGLIMIVEIRGWRTRDGGAYPDFKESTINGIIDAEVVQLMDAPADLDLQAVADELGQDTAVDYSELPF